jgi:hypothetical protein
LEQVLECGGVKPDKGIATLSSWWFSKGNTNKYNNINKRYKHK